MMDTTDEDLMGSGKLASLDAQLAAGIAKVAQGDFGRTVDSAREKLTLNGIFAKKEANSPNQAGSFRD